jgi:hypothetical protein
MKCVFEIAQFVEILHHAILMTAPDSTKPVFVYDYFPRAMYPGSELVAVSRSYNVIAHRFANLTSHEVIKPS